MSAFDDWYKQMFYKKPLIAALQTEPYDFPSYSRDDLEQAFNAGMERAAEELCKRGARMQLLKEFMQSRKCNSLANYWEQYCNINPEAETWFDNDGVPSKEISND